MRTGAGRAIVIVVVVAIPVAATDLRRRKQKVRFGERFTNTRHNNDVMYAYFVTREHAAAAEATRDVDKRLSVDRTLRGANVVVKSNPCSFVSFVRLRLLCADQDRRRTTTAPARVKSQSRRTSAKITRNRACR
jgi:hypothetical protein